MVKSQLLLALIISPIFAKEWQDDKSGYQTPTPTAQPTYANESPSSSTKIPIQTWSPDTTLAIHDISVPNAILGLILFASGICLTFFGQRVRTTTFLVGFLDLGLISFIIISVCLYKFGWHSAQDWIYLIVMVLAGLLGALVTMKFIKLTILILGGLFGYAVGLLALICGLGSIISMSLEAMIAFNIVVLAVGTTLIFFQEYVMRVGGCALLGALSLFMGLDVFIRSGFIEVAIASMTGYTRVMIEDGWWKVHEVGSSGPIGVGLVHGNVPLARVPSYVWALFAAVLVFFAFGCVVQTLPPPKSPPKPGIPRAALSFWPWQPVILPVSVPQGPKSWMNGA